MEKEHQPESLSTVTIKPDYPPSEVYSSEPPPAYMKPTSSAVQVAKIVAVTVVLCSVVLGSFLLASAYVTANASCRQLEQELELLGEASERFQAPQPLQPEALIQEQPIHKVQAEPLQTEEPKKEVKEVDNNNIDDSNDSSSDNSDSSDDSSDSSESDEDDKPAIRFKLPLQLDFDDIAGDLIEKNQKSRMNCVVEKKRAEEIVDHQPKTVRLPFGVNLTTDPKYEKVTGERMAIFCESGNFQRAQPQPQPQTEDDDEQDTIMIQPVMIPIPQGHFPTHMPQQMQPVVQRQQQPQIQMIHPMETMRPPMPPMAQPHIQIQQFVPPQQQQQSQMPPNPIIQHIIQQIIAQKIMEQQRAQEESQESTQPDTEQRPPPRMIIPEGMNGRLPIPEEVLTQLNRLPNREGIVVVSEQDPEDSNQEQDQMQVVQHQRTSPMAMNGRQTYARGLPVNIPVPMMQQEQQEQQDQQDPQEPQATASEEARPHYVQPRSIRSVDALLPKSVKRVKRCSCDCAC